VRFVDHLLLYLGFLSLRLGGRCMYNPALSSRSMVDLWWRRFDFLLCRRTRLLFGNRFWGGRGLTMGRRRGRRLGRSDFLRRRFYLRGRFRGGRGLTMGRPRGRRLGRSDFLRRPFYLRSRFRDGRGLRMGRPRGRRLGRGNFLRCRFYLGRRFRGREVRWTAMRGRRGCHLRLLLLSRRRGGRRSRRNMRCNLPRG
jgi:hypothetical protein